MTFGQAIEAVQQGKLMQRSGWNGKEMFIFHNPGYRDLPSEDIRHDAVRDYFWAKGVALVTFVPSLSLKAADGTVVTGWLASQTDVLAEDWQEFVIPPQVPLAA